MLTRIYCICGCLLFFICLVPPVRGESLEEGPCIKLNKTSFDFGEVDEGIKIDHTFKISNTGKALLNITDAHATCGCTIPTLEKKKLKPGESCKLQVIVDTSMKQKAITKTVSVSSNDPIHPKIDIQLSMFVKDPHKNMKGNIGVKIFKDAHCASCHVDRGAHKMGMGLYQTDCAMCHGAPARGAIGPALIGPYENEEFARSIKQVIAYGSKTHRSMPGFLADAGGPLSEEQIDSLVDFLARISRVQEHNNQRQGGLKK